MRKTLAAILCSWTLAFPALARPPVDPPARYWGEVRLAAFSPDGKFLVTYTDPSHGAPISNVLRLWDLSKAQTDKGERKGLVWTAAPFKAEKGSTARVHALAFSPDGKHVLAAGGYHHKEELRRFAAADGKFVNAHHLPGLSRAEFAKGARC